MNIILFLLSGLTDDSNLNHKSAINAEAVAVVEAVESVKEAEIAIEKSVQKCFRELTELPIETFPHQNNAQGIRQ